MLNFFNRNRRAFSHVSIYYRTSILLLMLASSALQASAQTVTLKATKTPLSKIFEDIKKQTGYRFFYDADLLDRGNPVTLDVVSQPIETVLNIIFENQPFSYAVEGRIITIITLAERRKRQERPKSVISAEDQKIQGRVTNSTGTRLEGVSITLKGKGGRRNATATRADGSFELSGQKGDILIITAVGLDPVEIRFNGEEILSIKMEIKTISLEAVQVSYDNIMRRKIPWTDTINLRNKSYMNLGQVLQGTIPGLSLQNSTATQTGVSTFSLDNGATYDRQRLKQLFDIFLAPTASSDYHDFDSWLNYATRIGAVRENYAASTQSNGLIPQLRGVSGFNGNISGMLIVIDGFIQEGFPAEYPIANIESIKVIKDPEELTKWGPRGLGGVILITSKKGVAGRLSVNYTANFSYSPAPKFERVKQQLATTADILDYQRAAADSGFLFGNLFYPLVYNKTASELLIYNWKYGSLSEETFAKQWDSLGNVVNDGQLKLLQQNAFRHNHIVRLSGATKNWNFSATGSYGTENTTALGNSTRSAGLNLNNDFLLSQGKLRANMQVIINGSRSRSGRLFNPREIQPYQLLIDDNGHYVYDYSKFNPTINQIIQKNGYFNAGENLLEDARLNYNQNKGYKTSSRITMDWDLFDGFRWSNSFQYEQSTFNRDNYWDALSSRARQQVNEYATPRLDISGVTIGINYHMPLGSILERYYTQTQALNLRSALIYERQFGKHRVEATVGGGGFSNGSHSPEWSTIYGYDPRSGRGSPIKLPTDPISHINNYFSLPEVGGVSNALPYLLLNPTFASDVVSRGLNWNGNVHYDYDKQFPIDGSYVSNIIPTYGAEKNYSYMTNYRLQAGYRIEKIPGIRLHPLVSQLSAAVGVEGFQIPGLPEQIVGVRTLQPGFGDYGIWVNSYNLVQQSGQRSRNTYQKITLGLAKDKLVLDASYNHLQNTGIISEKSDEFATFNYLAANAKVKLRNNLLQFVGGVGKSPEGKSQSNLRIAYDIGREKWFESQWINSLSTDATLRNISSYQGIQLMAGTNTPLTGGGFSPAINTNFGLLPPSVKSLEIHSTLAMFDDRYKFDLRYYNRTTDGLNNSIPVPTDPSSGLPSQVSYSSLQSKGVELYIVIKAIDRASANYTITLNGAYNRNKALSVPTVNYSQSQSYLTAYRNGYSTENIWSYRWAGLNTQGAPQIFDANGAKTAIPDSASLATALMYSGVVRAPYTGGLIQEAAFGDFFGRVSVIFNLGHVVRQYIPSPSGLPENSHLISRRWRQPGDENTTDIAAMANINPSSIRTFIIQNSNNSILPADHIRLQEVQIGWQAPVRALRNLFVKQFTISLQAQNLALWTRNKFHVDPETISSNGFIGLPQQRLFSLTLNMTL